jgi:hypothetical protein
VAVAAAVTAAAEAVDTGAVEVAADTVVAEEAKDTRPHVCPLKGAF